MKVKVHIKINFVFVQFKILLGTGNRSWDCQVNHMKAWLIIKYITSHCSHINKPDQGVLLSNPAAGVDSVISGWTKELQFPQPTLSADKKTKTTHSTHLISIRSIMCNANNFITILFLTNNTIDQWRHAMAANMAAGACALSIQGDASYLFQFLNHFTSDGLSAKLRHDSY